MCFLGTVTPKATGQYDVPKLLPVKVFWLRVVGEMTELPPLHRNLVPLGGTDDHSVVVWTSGGERR